MIVEVLALLVAICIAVLIFMLVKNVLLMIVNAIIGFFALIGFNYLFQTNIAVNIWTALITGVGGIFGFAIVVACHFLGWAFW